MKPILFRVFSGLALLFAAGCGPARDRVPRLEVALPFGMVDSIGTPKEDGSLQVSGWALSEDPVQAVSLYIDRRYVTTARLHEPRPDVDKAFPAYAPSAAGWTLEIDSRLFPGDREFVVQVRTAHDAVRELRTWKMQLPEKR